MFLMIGERAFNTDHITTVDFAHQAGDQVGILVRLADGQQLAFFGAQAAMLDDHTRRFKPDPMNTIALKLLDWDRRHEEAPMEEPTRGIPERGGCPLPTA